MTRNLDIYKCDVCGNIVEVVHASGGNLTCCDQHMKLMSPKGLDEGKEKHLPVIEKVTGGVKVNVGSINHPMEESHYIEWIEVVTKDMVLRKTLQPGQLPEAEFLTFDDIIAVREYCSVHGLWSTKI